MWLGIFSVDKFRGVLVVIYYNYSNKNNHIINLTEKLFRGCVLCEFV